MSELQNKILTAEPVPCSTHPILYDETKCVGCNACVNICQVDILIPSPEKGKHPIVKILYAHSVPGFAQPVFSKLPAMRLWR